MWGRLDWYLHSDQKSTLARSLAPTLMTLNPGSTLHDESVPRRIYVSTARCGTPSVSSPKHEWGRFICGGAERLSQRRNRQSTLTDSFFRNLLQKRSACISSERVRFRNVAFLSSCPLPMRRPVMKPDPSQSHLLHRNSSENVWASPECSELFHPE